MASLTPNFSLRKPAPADTVDVETDLNANWDIVDAELAAVPPSGAVTLTDGATVALDASLGKVFKLSAAGDRTISAPTGSPSDGQSLIIKHTASGGERTLTLTTGSAGAFKFGTDVPALSATASSTSDYIGCIYDSTAQRWHVLSHTRGL